MTIRTACVWCNTIIQVQDNYNDLTHKAVCDEKCAAKERAFVSHFSNENIGKRNEAEFGINPNNRTWSRVLPSEVAEVWSMTSEPEYNAHVRCCWCHAVRPVKESITYNGQTVCRDGDCLNHMKGHYVSGYSPNT